MATISQASAADAEALAAAFAGLVPQLSKSNPPPSLGAVEAMLAHSAITQFVARDDSGAIVGVATLAIFPIPTGSRAWIEDVIVEEASAGQGIGAELTTAMLEHAHAAGCVSVDLTSRPSREAANHLYKKLGFQPRDTNVYRFELEVDVQPLLVDARRSLLGTFEGLDGDEWDVPSLCDGWRVRDVLAHLTLAARPVPPPGRYLRAIARARGSFNEANRELAIIDGGGSPSDLVETFRGLVESRRVAPPGPMRVAPFADVVVHSLDVRVPLGIEAPVPANHHTVTLDFLLGPMSRFFGGKGRPEVRWVATDHDWSNGSGAEVRGTLADLVLALAGRDRHADRLEGDGAAAIQSWLR